jgi:hypothetical protein
VERGGFFSVERVKGRAFYFAPGFLSASLANIFPGLGSAVHFVIRRTGKPGRFIEVLDSGIEGIGDTPYYRGTGERASDTRVATQPVRASVHAGSDDAE